MGKKVNKIYCLFSIDNDYNQPEHNLCCWFKEKPSLERLNEIFRVDYCPEREEDVIRLSKGKCVRISGSSFWVQKLVENKLLTEIFD